MASGDYDVKIFKVFAFGN